MECYDVGFTINNPKPGAFITCTETFGNGAATGTGPIRPTPPVTHRVRKPAAPKFSGAADGIVVAHCCGRQKETT